MSEKLQQLRMDIDTQRERKKKLRKRLLLLLALLLAFAVGIVIILHQLGYLLFPWENTPNLVAGNMQAGTLEHLSGQDLLDYLQQQVDENHVSVQINTAPTFYSGSAAGDLMIQNSEANQYDMQVLIYLGNDSDGMLVYDSGRILPGYYIDNDKLNTVLNKGEYEAIAYVSFYNDAAHITTVSADMALTIQN